VHLLCQDCGAINEGKLFSEAVTSPVCVCVLLLSRCLGVCEYASVTTKPCASISELFEDAEGE